MEYLQLSALSYNLIVPAVIASALLFSYVLSRKSSRIPGPKGNLILGNIPAMKKYIDEQKIHNYFESLSKKYGKLCRLRILGPLVPFSPEYVLSTDTASLRKMLLDMDTYGAHNASFVEAIGLTAPNSLLITFGPIWKSHRKIVSSAFSLNNLQFAAEVINDVGDTFLERLDSIKKGPVNFNKEFVRMAMDVIGLVAFSVDFGTIKNGSDILDWFSTLIQSTNDRGFMPKFLWWTLDDQKIFKESIRKVKETAQKIIDQRRNNTAAGEHEVRKDLLQKLLDGCDEEGNKLSDEEVLAEVVLFFSAGHETTANSLSWVIYELCLHPDIQDKMRKELAEVLQSHRITYEQSHKLKYLDAVIKETMRLKPVTPFFSRVVTKPTKVMDYELPVGTILLFNTAIMNRDPEVYAQVEEFIPERWLTEDSTRIEKNFFPFGEGPKMCVGQKLAQLEMKIILSYLLRKYKFSLVPGETVEEVFTITLGPKDKLMVNITSLE